MEQEYAKLLKRQRTQTEKDPSRKLKLLQRRLEDMFQLLSLWTQYVEVIYMPESEIHVLSAIQNMEARPEDAAYGLRTQEAEIKNRINTLFSHKDEEERIAGDEGKPADEEYETVNEGMTTDTTEAPSHATKRGSLEAAESLQGGLDASGKKEEANEELQEGILSSDEEDAAAANLADKQVKQSKVGDKPLNDRGEHDIRAFADSGSAAKGVFETDKAREEVENRFNFGE